MSLINNKDKIFIAGANGMVGSAIKRKLYECQYINLECPSREETYALIIIYVAAKFASDIINNLREIPYFIPLTAFL